MDNPVQDVLVLEVRHDHASRYFFVPLDLVRHRSWSNQPRPYGIGVLPKHSFIDIGVITIDTQTLQKLQEGSWQVILGAEGYYIIDIHTKETIWEKRMWHRYPKYLYNE